MRYTVRRVMPNEYSKYRIHLKSLDPASKTLRFGTATSDETIDMLCAQWEVDQEHHVLFCVEDCNLNFIAIGHIATQDTMELAFSVLKEYQGHGLGNTLMCRCIQYCRVIGQLHGHMVCLTHNAAIKHLCVKHHIKIQTVQGETLAAIELDHAELQTYVQEGFDHGLAAFDYMSKRYNYAAGYRG